MLFSWFRRRRDAVVCRQAVELVTEYLEGTLPDRDRARLEAHLAGCPHCTEYVRQMQLTVGVLKRVELEELEPAARDDLVNLYRRWKAG